MDCKRTFPAIHYPPLLLKMYFYCLASITAANVDLMPTHKPSSYNSFSTTTTWQMLSSSAMSPKWETNRLKPHLAGPQLLNHHFQPIQYTFSQLLSNRIKFEIPSTSFTKTQKRNKSIQFKTQEYTQEGRQIIKRIFISIVTVRQTQTTWLHQRFSHLL